jgi:hypothetical protein
VLLNTNAADLTPIPIGGNEEVFIRDLKTGVTTMVSVTATGTKGADGL